jgi:outer membrane protein
LFLPTFSASGGLGYSGPGQQRFLTSNFSQTVATSSSNYNLGLDWTLSGQTLAAPGQRNAVANAVEADIAGASAALVNGVTQQYLTVLQSRDNADVAVKQLARDEDALKLAQARYAVGSASLIDVRQAQVARGTAEVTVLRAQTDVSVQKLRLFEQMGVTAPTDVKAVQLTDTFPVVAPKWTLDDLLGLAAEQNPALQALRARETSARWNVRAALAAFGPSLNVSAGWSGFTQKYNNLQPIILGQQAAFGSQYASCNDNNTIRTNAGLPPNDCSVYVWGSQNTQALIDQNNQYPYKFTSQPFSARLTISLPIWLNFSRPYQASQARADKENLSESVRARALGLQTEVSQAYLNLQTAYQTIAIQDTNRTAAREQLQLATDRYRVGSGTYLELTDAQVTALRAETDYVNSVYDYHKALAALEAAVGRPLR